MRPVPTPSRARRHLAPRPALAGFAVVTALVTLLTGCTAAPASQRLVDRAKLVNDLASRLDHASNLTYTAEYQLPGGKTASIVQAQQPLRTAYRYPGGALLLLPTATVNCRTDGTGTCTMTPPPSPGTAPPDPVLNAIADRGLMVPNIVIGLLTAASLDSNAVIDQHDSTIAGQHATCVDVSGVDNAAASAFSACITTDGVLGSFSGTLGTTPVHTELFRYQDTAVPEAFAMPAGVRVVDQRPR